METKLCACGNPRRKGGRHCLECHAASMRKSRFLNLPPPLTEIERYKQRARWYLQTYVKRGVIERGHCHICGKPNAHGHHSDYSKPLQVLWLCPEHHYMFHELNRQVLGVENPAKMFHVEHPGRERN